MKNLLQNLIEILTPDGVTLVDHDVEGCVDLRSVNILISYICVLEPSEMAVNWLIYLYHDQGARDMPTVICLHTIGTKMVP